MLREIKKLTEGLRRKVGQIVSKGVLNLTDDTLKTQELQVELMADEVLDGVERYQQYGFTSHPLSGAEVLGVSVGGNRGHSVVIAIEDKRYRLKSLVAGEVGIYTDEGDTIILKRGKKIEITAGADINLVATTTVNITAPTVVVNASSKVTVNSPLVEVPSGDVTATGISLKTHVHSGVQSGASNTGLPV